MFIHQPLVYCHFAQGVGEPRYHQVPYFSLAGCPKPMLLILVVCLFFIKCGNKIREFNCF